MPEDSADSCPPPRRRRREWQEMVHVYKDSSDKSIGFGRRGVHKTSRRRALFPVSYYLMHILIGLGDQ